MTHHHMPHPTYHIKKHLVMTPAEEWAYLLLVALGLILTFFFGLWWFRLDHIPHNFTGQAHGLDIAIFIALSYIVWHQVINELFVWCVSYTMQQAQPVAPEAGHRVAFLTA